MTGPSSSVGECGTSVHSVAFEPRRGRWQRHGLATHHDREFDPGVFVLVFENAPISSVPVDVSGATSLASARLVVTANALGHLDSGTYAVEVVDADGSTRVVPVEIGTIAGRNVEIIGDVKEATEVITP